jgi:hypothetical protein
MQPADVGHVGDMPNPRADAWQRKDVVEAKRMNLAEGCSASSARA